MILMRFRFDWLEQQKGLDPFSEAALYAYALQLRILASAGVNMGKFCTDFNAKTADRKGEIVPVIITAYEDKSCDFVVKTSPVAGLILKAAGIQKGSATGRKTQVGKITRAQLRQIAEYKLPDLNCEDIEAAMRIVEGSANNMGVEVVD